MSISTVQSGYSAASRFQPFTTASNSKDTATAQAGANTTSSTKAANNTHRPAIKSGSILSTGTNTVLLAQQEADQAKATTTKTYTVDTSKGKTDIDFDEYFSPKKAVTSKLSLDDIPLLMPSANNIAALTADVSSRLKQVLSGYGISAPQSISYDGNGKMILPDDYQHRDKWQQALEENPSLERELRTVNALTSHYVELQKLAPFNEEYAAAQTQAETDAVVQKYSYLFRGNRDYSEIALHFTEDGLLSLTADGKAVPLA